MRALIVVALVAAAGVDSAAAQPPGKWPPDSLVNVQVIPKTTQPVQVWGMMRNIAGALGVSCTFCHVGSDSAPLERIDFATDEKRNKRVARQMMRMVQEVNTRLDTIPSRPTPTVTVTCITCHRGVNRPVPLASIIVDAATAAGADSAIRTYRALRDRYYGRDAYDFGEVSLTQPRSELRVRVRSMTRWSYSVSTSSSTLTPRPSRSCAGTSRSCTPTRQPQLQHFVKQYGVIRRTTKRVGASGTSIQTLNMRVR